MNQVIVTGATGFIGTYFVKYLTDQGIAVLAIGRKNFEELSKVRQEKLVSSTYLKLDMSKILSLADHLDQLGWKVSPETSFVNLAWGGVDKLSDLNIKAQLDNVIWSVNAMEAASLIGCSRFIHIGTMEEAFTYKYLELDHNINAEYNRHVIYSVAKIAAKYSLRIKAREFRIDYIHVLHSHVMGPDDDKDSFLQVTLKKLINGEELIFSSGEQLFDVVSPLDCCKAYYLICCNGIPDSEYWVGSGDPRKLREYVERMFHLYPSAAKLQFGMMPYNDIKLQASDFSIKLLTEHTGYAPMDSYENIVRDLHKSLSTDTY